MLAAGRAGLGGGTAGASHAAAAGLTLAAARAGPVPGRDRPADAGIPATDQETAMSTSLATTTEPATTPPPSRVRALATVVRRRLPFTTGVLVAIIVTGIATGALWDAAEDRTWFDQVGYGLPALAAGQWWTPVTGAFFALTPLFYLPVLVSFALFAGAAEWRLGTGRTAVICGLGQLAGVLGAALTLLIFQDTGWT